MGVFSEENHQIVIAPEVKVIPEFAALIRRDKTPEKKRSFQELAFIYFVTDYKSPYIIYPKDERIQRVKRELGLSPDWTPDKGVIDAQLKYDELQRTPSISTLIAIRESLMTSTKVIETLRSRIEDRLVAFNTPPAEGEDESDIEEINSIVQSVSSLLVLADKLPKAIGTLEDLEEKVKMEQSNGRKIRGGGDINSFEN
jgi:hypothetical protein